MHGLRLDALLPVYQTLSRTLPLALVCLQETMDGHAETIAAALGLAVVAHPNEGLGMVYDATALELVETALVPLPKLAAMPRWAWVYMRSRDPEQKYALACKVLPRHGGEPFTVVNFHLDAAGGNTHRRAQLQHMVDALPDTRRVLACGDANIFALRNHGDAYARLLQPLRDIGAFDPETRPTHFFARSREPRLGQRVMARLGRYGLDVPLRYDVMCSNLPVAQRGQVETPDSDHDLLWVRLKGIN
jgi:endonuclease/exonuclease/phosphatase family metal-dependent hydrolase